MSLRLLSHIVVYDDGFAPNPFGGYLTLASGLAALRRQARVDDWVIGTGAPRGVGERRLIYAARIDEKLALQDYWTDQRFQFKKPNDENQPWGWRGDNLFHQDPQGQWLASDSRFYDAENLSADVVGQAVLVSRHFWYFGVSAPLLSTHFDELRQQGLTYRTIENAPLINEFLGWLTRHSDPGLLDRPGRRAP